MQTTKLKFSKHKMNALRPQERWASNLSGTEASRHTNMDVLQIRTITRTGITTKRAKTKKEGMTMLIKEFALPVSTTNDISNNVKYMFYILLTFMVI